MNISQVKLQTPEGTPVELGSYIDRPTIVVLVRYFG